MAKRGISISVKLISVSTILLILVIGLFGVMSNLQSRRLIDDSTERLRTKTTAQMRGSGAAQLRLLAESTRIALVQSDFTTLQTTIANIGKDEGVTLAAVVDPSGTVLAHAKPEQAGKPAEGLLKKVMSISKVEVMPEQDAGGQPSMVFISPVVHEGNRLCGVLVAYSLKPLQAELKQAEELKAKELKANLRNVLVIGLLSVLLGVLLTIFQGLRISRPIQALARQADKIAGGDLEARVEIKTHDEIGLLGDRFNYMVEQVLVLLRETMQKAGMEKELEVASAIQSTLVPDAAVADLPGIKVAGYFKSATQCGGDWWSYYALTRNRTLVIIGDVTGHGVASAMITATAKGAATTMMAITGGELELIPLLRAMNAAIHDAARGKFVMTCFASIFDPATRTLTFANAGHNFPYLYDGATGKLVSLVVRGNRLGDLQESSYELKTIDVKPSDTLIWYTDGIVECEDVRGEEYGERRFRSVIRQHAAKEPNQARDEIIGRATQFFGEVQPKDDITLVLGKIT